MLNVKTVDPEKYIGLVQKGKPKNETYQKIRKDIQDLTCPLAYASFDCVKMLIGHS